MPLLVHLTLLVASVSILVCPPTAATPKEQGLRVGAVLLGVLFATGIALQWPALLLLGVPAGAAVGLIRRRQRTLPPRPPETPPYPAQSPSTQQAYEAGWYDALRAQQAPALVPARLPQRQVPVSAGIPSGVALPEEWPSLSPVDEDLDPDLDLDEGEPVPGVNPNDVI